MDFKKSRMSEIQMGNHRGRFSAHSRTRTPGGYVRGGCAAVIEGVRCDQRYGTATFSGIRGVA